MTRILKIEPTAIAGKGRGLRATQTIAKGDMIDSAPAVLLPAVDCDRLEGTALGDFYFAHPDNPDDGLVVLGLPSLCNHADLPNADVRWSRDANSGYMAELIALRDIAGGEEITYRYRCAPWFKVVA